MAESTDSAGRQSGFRWQSILLVLVAAATSWVAFFFLLRGERGALMVGIVGACMVYLLLLMKDGKAQLRRVLIPILLVTILLPPLRIKGLPHMRLDLPMIIALWYVLELRFLSAGRLTLFHGNPINKWFCALALTIFVSMWYAAVVHGQPVIGRDFWEFFKVFQYFILFYFFASVNIRPNDIKLCFQITLLALIASALVGFAQLIDLFGVNTWLSPHYAPTALRGLFIHGRITGTTANPNDFGAMMIIGAAMGLAGMLWFRKWKQAVLPLVAFVVCSVALGLTLSRSSMITLGVTVISVLALRSFQALRQRDGNRRLIVVLLILGVGSVIFLNLAPDKFLIRMAQLGDVMAAKSFQGRLEAWEYNLAIWERSPIFGWGPAKDNMRTIVDSEWVLLLRRYGIVGVIVIIIFALHFFVGIADVYRRSANEYVTVFAVGALGILVSYPVTMASNYIIFSTNFQIMPLLMIYFGLIFSLLRQELAAEPGRGPLSSVTTERGEAS